MSPIPDNHPKVGYFFEKSSLSSLEADFIEVLRRCILPASSLSSLLEAGEESQSVEWDWQPGIPKPKESMLAELPAHPERLLGNIEIGEPQPPRATQKTLPEYLCLGGPNYRLEGVYI
jgi:hypothetical protein